MPSSALRGIPELRISKIQPGIYEAHVVGARSSGCDGHLYGSIAEVLREAGAAIADHPADFIEVRYGDVSIGTQAIATLITDATALADRLTSMDSAVRRSRGKDDVSIWHSL